jgi:hypothetical protein
VPLVQEVVELGLQYLHLKIIEQQTLEVAVEVEARRIQEKEFLLEMEALELL